VIGQNGEMAETGELDKKTRAKPRPIDNDFLPERPTAAQTRRFLAAKEYAYDNWMDDPA
jgi:hypothetical protein